MKIPKRLKWIWADIVNGVKYKYPWCCITNYVWNHLLGIHMVATYRGVVLVSEAKLRAPKKWQKYPYLRYVPCVFHHDKYMKKAAKDNFRYAQFA